MIRHRILAAALLAGAAPLPALAQAAPASPVAPAEIDPLRLAAARVTVDHIFPEGTYARLMNGSLDAVMKSVMDGVSEIPVKQLAAIGGVKPEDTAKLGDANLRQMMDIIDPAYRQRMELTTHTMMTEMSKLMTTFEPGIRDGLARAYAKRFTVEQLSDLNRFFATPTGTAYASDSMLLFMDPEVMAKMQNMMPEMMKQMPAIIQTVEAATASLPKPKEFKDLNAAERQRLAQLLGIPETELGKKKKGN